MKPLSFCVGQYGPFDTFLRDLDEAARISPKAEIRLDAVWRYCSDSSGTKYNFSALDAKVAAVRERGMHVRFVIPMWCPDGVLAGRPDKTQIKTASALLGFGSFVRALVDRFGSTVKEASTGNEPNISNPFAPDGPDPAFQAEVTEVIVSELPDTWRAYTPGLAPASDAYDKVTKKAINLSPMTYLTQFWASLTSAQQARLHAIELHPYGRAGDVTQSWSTLGKIDAMHRLTGKPISASEYNSDWNDSDAAKAANIPLGLDYMLSRRCVERVFIYAMSDAATDGNYRLGLIDGSGMKRPAYATVARWASEHG